MSNKINYTAVNVKVRRHKIKKFCWGEIFTFFKI